MYRRLAPRLVGLCVAVIVLMAATQLLTLSVSSDPVLDREDVHAVTRWMRRAHNSGAEVLIGLALFAAGCWLAWALVASLGIGRKVLTSRRGDGWTRIDRRSLAESLERSLAPVDPHATVAVNVRRNRRVDLTVVTTSPWPDERLEETRAELERLLGERGLPCRAGRVAAKTPRRDQRSRVR
ncbi:MAG: hypothetical protein LC808_23000 [Actinobacteria bacterium]|nr:hypothetical protein [Actinomycetota bacterium]